MFLVLAIVAALGVTGLQATLEDAGTDEVVENESFDPQTGTVQALEESDRDYAYYDETVVVVDENGNATTEGIDYQWYPSNGTIKPLSGGELDGDGSAEITYRYQVTTEEQRGIAGALANIPRVLGLALPLGALVFVLAAFRGAS